VFGLLRRLDHPAPQVSADTIRATSPRRAPGWARAAAGILLALAVGGVAYAAPGSPLAGVVHRLVEWVSRATQEPAETPPSVPGGPQAGIAVPPGDRLTIVFPADLPDAIATVVLTDGTEVVVRAVGGAASFNSDVDRLSVEQAAAPARFEIHIPHVAPRVEIRIGERRVFLKGAAGVSTEFRPDAEGRYLIPLSRSRP